MRKLRMMFFSVLCVLMTAVTAFAQDAADNESSVNKYKALAAGFGFAIAAGLGALGQSRIAASAVKARRAIPAQPVAYRS